MAIAHQVVILGGGFGGLYAARILKSRPVSVTLIDRRNYHLFQPLMYQVATGSLSPGEIAAPLRGILRNQKNTRVLLGEAADIDPAAKQVTLADGAIFAYNSLIVATGSETSYFGHDQWQQWAPSLKTFEEALAVRHKILYAFEAAERASDPAERRAWLTFVIVGAGATGLELAGSLAEIARETLRYDFRSIHPQDARIILIDSSPRPLPTYPEDLSQKAARLLARLGVEVRTNVRVVGIDNAERGASRWQPNRTIANDDGHLGRGGDRLKIWREAGGTHGDGNGPQRPNSGELRPYHSRLSRYLRGGRSRARAAARRHSTSWRCPGRNATGRLRGEINHQKAEKTSRVAAISLLR